MHYFGVPVLVKVIDGRDAPAVPVGVVHVPDVVGALAGVAGHHSVGPPADVVLRQAAPVWSDIGCGHDRV